MWVFNPIKIIPLLDRNNRFIFTYKVLGIDSNQIRDIFIKVVKGKSALQILLFSCKKKNLWKMMNHS